MKYVYWARSRKIRLLIILLATLAYFFLLTLDALNYFPHFVSSAGSSWLPWMHFGFSAFISLMFLAVGSLVWLYARNRCLATLLFFCCLAMMVAFAAETDASLKDTLPLLEVLGTVGGSLAVYLFALLVLLFPKDSLTPIFSSNIAKPKTGARSRLLDYSILVRRGYVIVLTLLTVISVLYDTFYNTLPSSFLSILGSVERAFNLLALTGILVTIIISYRQSSSQRERQQRRLFVCGVVVSVAPLLVLTVLPKALNLPAQYTVDSQLSTLTVSLLPLALGYTILRYQVLIFDMYIRRAVAWLVGAVGLAVLGYIVVTCSSLLLSKNISTDIIGLVVVMALLGPFVWWLGKVVTERLFFSEMSYYRRLIENPSIMSNETIDLNEASLLLTTAAVSTFETQEVCLFILDEDTGYYRLYPLLKDDAEDTPRRSLAQRLLSVSGSSVDAAAGWLHDDALILRRLASTRRPLLLSETIKSDDALHSGLARFLTTTAPLDSTEPALAPILAQGRMIGLLVLGERGDHQQYAGPDFEALHLLLARFSPVLETARLYEKASRHTAILNILYSSSTTPINSFETLEEVATFYAKVAAAAVMGRAEIWLCQDTDDRLQCVAYAGDGPRLLHQDDLIAAQILDWSPCFYTGEEFHSKEELTAHIPPCLPQASCFPFAWIPLQRGQQRLGVLVLTYPRPHLFAHEEKRVLEMFAVQCAVALENARITIELRMAYEHQKELDRLKDQFIVTASHELRTPLTAVQGYIELLATYNAALSPEVRADFIAKAHRGCDELTLMVGNIMDASRVQIDAENVKLDTVPLGASVHHVLEILEALIRREDRTIQADLLDDIYVMADDLRLRQVLLNLVGNAIKYSPVGSSIEVTIELDDEQVTVYVRDHGLGVPLEEQKRLFERFVRLERDMNSPARGAGLGLFISKQLVEAMGGHIWVESTGVPLEGSVFAFTLQRSNVDADLKELTLKHQGI